MSAPEDFAKAGDVGAPPPPPLFTIADLSALVREDPELPPVLIEGWLHKSSIGMLTGSMKTNKSWTLMDLLIALATELRWFERKCTQSTVLYFDAEIDRPFWQKRFRALCKQRGLDPQKVADAGRILPVFIAGKDITIASLEKELRKMHERGELDNVDLIIIDPIYQLYDPLWQENRNDDMAKLGKCLRFISEFSGIGTVFAHHHTKGSQDGKRDIEKASGGGSFGRFVASSLAITHVGDEDSNKFTLGWTTSHFQRSPKQVAVRDGFQWIITDEDPKTVERKVYTIDQLMAALPDEEATSERWLELSGIPQGEFESLRPKAKKDGRVYKSQLSGKWEPTSKELERRGVRFSTN
jgi:hypothetical protein